MKRIATDPFQISESASIIQSNGVGLALGGQSSVSKVSGGNFISSQLESSFKASQKLSQLLWQLPYADRKSILQ